MVVEVVGREILRAAAAAVRKGGTLFQKENEQRKQDVGNSPGGIWISTRGARDGGLSTVGLLTNGGGDIRLWSDRPSVLGVQKSFVVSSGFSWRNADLDCALKIDVACSDGSCSLSERLHTITG